VSGKKFLDPYASAFPQFVSERRYPVGRGTGAFSILIVLASVFALVVRFRATPQDQGASLSTTLPVLVAIFVAVFLALNNIRSVTCGPLIIHVKYWFKPSKKLAWIEIVGLEVIPFRGGRFCIIETSNKRFGFLIDLLPETTAKLIKTIIVRASLRFAGRMSGQMVYRRWSAN
jgi:hypothetical protein